jgi:hypothetical protein
MILSGLIPLLENVPFGGKRTVSMRSLRLELLTEEVERKRNMISGGMLDS